MTTIELPMRAPSLRSALLGSSGLTDRLYYDQTRPFAGPKAANSNSQLSGKRKTLHRTTAAERYHRDSEYICETEVVQRNHAGEIPD